MFLDRSHRTGRFLEWKVRIFTVGAVLGLVGIYFEEPWMTGSAIAVLLMGMLLRFLPGAPREVEEDEAEESDLD